MTSDSKGTAIIPLNWNTEDLLQKFLPGLLLSSGYSRGEDGVWTSGGKADVIVADSGSTDGSLSLLKSSFKGVETIPLGENHGYAGGYDRAIERIPAGKYRYLVLINTDVNTPPGWLEPLISFMDSHPECSACCPKLHSYKDPSLFEYAGAAGGLIDRYLYPFCLGRLPGLVEKDSGQYGKEPVEVFWATGACIMVRDEDFRREGGFDESFFAHMEEIDLCWRMLLSGRRIFCVEESTVEHIGGGTLPASSPKKLYLNFRNNLAMGKKNLSKTLALQYLAAHPEKTLRKAAKAGVRRAGKRIFFRKCLDGLSAAVYLCKGKFSLFKAVVMAHRDSSRWKAPSLEEVEKYLQETPARYRGWLYEGSMLLGRYFSLKKFRQKTRGLYVKDGPKQ